MAGTLRNFRSHGASDLGESYFVARGVRIRGEFHSSRPALTLLRRATFFLLRLMIHLCCMLIALNIRGQCSPAPLKRHDRRFFFCRYLVVVTPAYPSRRRLAQRPPSPSTSGVHIYGYQEYARRVVMRSPSSGCSAGWEGCRCQCRCAVYGFR